MTTIDEITRTLSQSREPTTYERLLHRLELLLGNDFVTWTVETSTDGPLPITFDICPSQHVPVVVDIVDGPLTGSVRPGAILASVNEHLTLDDELSDITTFLSLLEESKLPRKLRFCRPGNVATDRAPSSISGNSGGNSSGGDAEFVVQHDIFGFSSTHASISLLKNRQDMMSRTTARRDMEWVQYLKNIGGPGQYA